MRAALFIVAMLVAAPPSLAAERDRSLLVDGGRRSYTLITPDKATGPYPLIIVYHGGTQTADQARRYTRFDELPKTEAVAVVYPQGLDNNWNDGRSSPDISARESAAADDVAFTAQIIGELEVEGIVDGERVYLTGASNGGMMAMRAGCEISNRIAAIAPVVANRPVDWSCNAPKLAAIFIHGTDDQYMPYAGGQVAVGKTRRNLGEVISADATIAEFKRIDGCASVKETKKLDAVGRDKTIAIVTDYECTKAPLKQIVIEGGGHTWPGARHGIIADWLLGSTSEEVNATAEIWAFFKPLSR
jgi:polyhydroxybutyrate depolymerase